MPKLSINDSELKFYDLQFTFSNIFISVIISVPRSVQVPKKQTCGKKCMRWVSSRTATGTAKGYGSVLKHEKSFKGSSPILWNEYSIQGKKCHYQKTIQLTYTIKLIINKNVDHCDYFMYIHTRINTKCKNLNWHQSQELEQ